MSYVLNTSCRASAAHAASGDFWYPGITTNDVIFQQMRLVVMMDEILNQCVYFCSPNVKKW